MDWHIVSADNALNELKTNKDNGLSQKEANLRISAYGKNVLEEKKNKSLFKKFLAQFSDFMVLILIAAAIISFVTSLLQGEMEIVDPVIILFIVLVNAIMGVIQESKAERAIEALKKLSAPTARVKREGKVATIKTEEIVSGDILILEAGDFVPADARLLETVVLKVEEASLTGESLPVEKEAGLILKENTPVADRKNMLFATTVITSGRCTAVAVETGMRSQVGKIAKMINEDETPQTPLQIKLEKTGKMLGFGAIIICAALFAMGVIQNVPMFEMLMISVSLAVAAIPEGLPAVVTIVLALGVQRMVKNNAIIRKLPAVETLGCATVICSDKTGTLTQNKMTVTETCSPNGSLHMASSTAKEILSFSTLCNNSTINYSKELKIEGDPTETALVEATYKLGIHKDDLDKKFARMAEIPFSSERKLMTTIHKLSNGAYRVITKGAPDVLLSRCTHFLDEGEQRALNEAKAKQIGFLNENMAKKALRVIGVAYKDIGFLPSKKELALAEEKLTFAGLIGMLDPPRPEVKEAVNICRRAGIKPVMITGDHIITATAIAKDIGILKENDLVMSGKELDLISNEELTKKINSYSVFARVAPEHKVRIVKAFQKRGEIVAMTGDGVNDAPALKSADIGCAMGIGGTDVAKGAADMILTDDNFASIVKAVREGRGIFDNIKRAVHFLLSCNIGEIITVFAAFLFHLPTPLLAIQLLWVNLVTDSLPALALGVEGIEKDVMNKKPISSKKSLFSGGLAFSILIEGLMIGALSLLAFSIGRGFFDLTSVPIVGRTMAFAVLSLSQLVHSFNMRSEHSIFKTGLFSNKALWGAFIVGTILQVSVISIEPLANLFKVVPLNFVQWEIVAGLSLVPLLTVELEKSFKKKKEYTYSSKGLKEYN